MGPSAGDGIDRLVAESEIRAVVLRMMRAIDRMDKELASTCVHEGATGHFLGFQGSFGDYLTSMWGTLERRFSSSMHFAGNILIDFSDDDPNVAVSEMYVMSFHTSADPVNSPQDGFVFGGRYVDRLEKRPTPARSDGAWGIVERIVVWDWRIETDPRVLGVAKPGSVVGRRGREDAVYEMLRSALGEPPAAGS